MWDGEVPYDARAHPCPVQKKFLLSCDRGIINLLQETQQPGAVYSHWTGLVDWTSGNVEIARKPMTGHEYVKKSAHRIRPKQDSDFCDKYYYVVL